MGFREKKNKAEKKWRALKIGVLCFLLIALTGLCVFSAFCPPKTWKYYVGKPDVSKRKDGELRIHMLDVGQSECILLEFPDGKTALIDGGDGRETTNKTILRYLNALKIDTIDVLIVTHTDADHCGGLDEIIQNKKIKTAYLPNVEPTENTQYAEVYNALLDEECPFTAAHYGLRLGNNSQEYSYAFTCIYPYTLSDLDGTESNERSSVFWLDYNGVSALFTGDMSTETETNLAKAHRLGVCAQLGVDLSSTEILKVAHHGSSNSTSASFLELLGVETALISCGENNVYGHPTEQVLHNLQTVGATTYRTDRQGHIVVTITPSGTYAVETE
ncbi:MAG: MBL fold metallo-hydrolase [Clostridia bacterium]|nr:MBL fold metallo-hydrolase [Clostridia bacterium]